jgi:Spy/CpxP family protein refolding chaperone
MKMQRFIVSSLAVIFMVTAGFSYKGKASGGGMRLWNDLKLTAEQQEKIKTLHNDMTALRTKNHDEIQVVRQKIIDELKKDNPSKKALDEYARELGELNTRQAQERNNHLLQIKEIFTPEQFNKILGRQASDGKGRNGVSNNGCQSVKTTPDL